MCKDSIRPTAKLGRRLSARPGSCLLMNRWGLYYQLLAEMVMCAQQHFMLSGLPQTFCTWPSERATNPG